MDTIFMNSENKKNPSDSGRLLLNLLDEVNLRKSDEYIALWNLNIYLLCMEKYIKVIKKTLNSK